MLYFAFVILLVAIDQLVKYLVSTTIPLGGSAPFLPYIMDLTYVKNPGCAFSMLEKHTWLLALVSAVMSVLLAVALAKKYFKHPIGRTALALLLAGAAGNLIDRLVLGYVVDMFRTLFMDFAVFNVADICVVVGGIAAAIYYLFLYDKLEGKKHEHTQADS